MIVMFKHSRPKNVAIEIDDSFWPKLAQIKGFLASVGELAVEQHWVKFYLSIENYTTGFVNPQVFLNQATIFLR